MTRQQDTAKTVKQNLKLNNTPLLNDKMFGEGKKENDMTKIYEVEVAGLITIEAESPKDAVKRVLTMFEEDDLSYNDLVFTCDDETK